MPTWTYYGTAILAMAVSYTIETSSWWIKALAAQGELGLYISRSNIYLYFGRFFALAFNALIAVRIEQGDTARAVLNALAFGFGAACLMHVILLRGTPLTWRGMELLRRVLFLPASSRQVTGAPSALRFPLVASTAGASFAFSLGTIVPLCLAVLVPSYRMSLSYTGQLLNAGGTLLLLFYVDQQLFRAIDRNELVRELPSYSAGRVIGFAVSGGLCYLFAVLGVGLG